MNAFYRLSDDTDFTPGDQLLLLQGRGQVSLSRPHTIDLTLRASLTGGKHEQLQREFNKHHKKWHAETRFMSAPEDKYLHPSYARIIGMGRPVVRLILQSLQKEAADWFYALRAITGANPVTDDMAGDMHRMREAWLKWGSRRGLVPDEAEAKTP